MKLKFKLIAAFKIWLVIYPSILVFQIFLGQFLANLPLYQRSFVLTFSLVPWMVFIGLPVIEKLFTLAGIQKTGNSKK